MKIALSLLFGVLLGFIHILAGKLRFLDTIPRSRWLSMAGGASTAYVFVHLLPELRKGQATIEQTVPDIVAFVEHHVYLVALIGFAAFYGLESMARKISLRKNTGEEGHDQTDLSIFWIHILSFAAYYALIGYLLLHQEEPGISSMALFSVSMGLHFFVNDYGLRQHHKKSYDRIGRWLLAVSVLIGWTVGYFSEIHEAAIAVLFAFLGGGIILNVIKEELPKERESRFWAFALGLTVYTVILLAS